MIQYFKTSIFSASSLSKFIGPYMNFSGLFCIDNIPNEIRKHHFAIINLSKQDEKGSHWLTLHRTIDGCIEVFDSLGYDLRKKNILSEHFPFTYFQINLTPVQSQDSFLCGQFCIYYVVERFLHFDEDFSEFMNDRFSSNCARNEEKLKNFCVENGISIV